MTNSKVVCQVLETNDYGKFKFIAGNRVIAKLHVSRLKQSFQNVYLISPILVNQNFEIIDGQNRYLAAMELNLPIRYIIVNDYGIREVQILNTNMKNWKKEDYLQSYCELKYPEYLKFKNFMRRFPDFGIASAEAILTLRLGGNIQRTDKNFTDTNDGSYTIKYFEEGDLSIPDLDYSIECAEKIMMYKPFYEGFNRRIFVVANLGIFKVDGYIHSQMIQRLKSNPTALQHCATVGQYKIILEEIYNFRSREKLQLRIY